MAIRQLSISLYCLLLPDPCLPIRHRVHYLLALLLTPVWASQGKSNRRLGWHYKSGDVHILLEMVCKDGFLTRSPEKGQRLSKEEDS